MKRHLLLPLLACATMALTPSDGAFVAQTRAAMTTMMTAMDVHPTGDADEDFVAMMVPHHQGAIDMAEAEICYGRNDRLKRLAQEIIVTQEQEIAAMRLALGQPISSPVSTQPSKDCEAKS